MERTCRCRSYQRGVYVHCYASFLESNWLDDPSNPRMMLSNFGVFLWWMCITQVTTHDWMQETKLKKTTSNTRPTQHKFQPPYLKPTSQSTNTKTPTNSKNPTRFQLQNLHQTKEQMLPTQGGWTAASIKLDPNSPQVQSTSDARMVRLWVHQRWRSWFSTWDVCWKIFWGVTQNCEQRASKKLFSWVSYSTALFLKGFFEDTHIYYRWDRRYFCNPNNSWNRPNDLLNTPILSLALTGVALFFTVINEIWEKLVDHIWPTRIFGWDSQIPFQGLGVTSDHVYFDGAINVIKPEIHHFLGSTDRPVNVAYLPIHLHPQATHI